MQRHHRAAPHPRAGPPLSVGKGGAGDLVGHYLVATGATTSAPMTGA